MSFETSIIIPVFNKWELTRDCLKSIAATTDSGRIEVIVVDNASSDVTPRACPFLGNTLFGRGFKYIRNDQNRNFAGASNQGAEQASADYLLFLNNDTRVQPNWYEPLIGDLSTYRHLGATGSILVYPGTEVLGQTVQHLGVFVSPFMKFGHLYQGIPAASSLTKKRRFLQAITGACMLMRKSVFMEAGGFDEEFINGFEDVDLCARIGRNGYKFTVNPESRTIHLEGQSEKRSLHDEANYRRLCQGNISCFKPDWHSLLAGDGLILGIDDWPYFQPRLAEDIANKISSELNEADENSLKSVLGDYPYLEHGWKTLLGKTTDKKEYTTIFKAYFRFFRNIPNAARAIQIGAACKDAELKKSGENYLRIMYQQPDELLESTIAYRDWTKKLGLDDLAAAYQDWISKFPVFRSKIYPLYMDKYFSLAGIR